MNSWDRAPWRARHCSAPRPGPFTTLAEPRPLQHLNFIPVCTSCSTGPPGPGHSQNACDLRQFRIGPFPLGLTPLAAGLVPVRLPECRTGSPQVRCLRLLAMPTFAVVAGAFLRRAASPARPRHSPSFRFYLRLLLTSAALSELSCCYATSSLT